MTQFESCIKTIPFSQERVYAKLSDLSNLEAIRNKIPADKVSDLTIDADSLSFSVAPVGNIKLAIVDREPCKCVKFEAKESPIKFFLWIQIVPLKDNDQASKIKLTLQAELNPFIKAMVQSRLQEGLDKMAEVMAMLPY